MSMRRVRASKRGIGERNLAFTARVSILADPHLSALIMGNPVARAFAITGDSWTQLILREAFYGVRRFSVWRERLGIPRSVLTDRLHRLVAAGLLKQILTGENSRTEYRLTEMGLDRFGIAVMLGQWERTYAQSIVKERYAIAFFDRATGRRLTPAVLTRPGGIPVCANKIDWRPGPGLQAIAPPTSRRRRSNPRETDRPIVDHSTDIMGDYWSCAVLSAACFRVRRFDEMHAVLQVATNILSDRLARLVLQGVLEKRPYQTLPVRFEYRLTDAGRALYPVILAMHGWSLRWLVSDNESPLTLIDRESGQALTPVVCDLKSGEPMDPRRVSWQVETASPGRPINKTAARTQARKKIS
jgi:DNA-binding HxlR family transcriptional regulator